MCNRVPSAAQEVSVFFLSLAKVPWDLHPAATFALAGWNDSAATICGVAENRWTLRGQMLQISAENEVPHHQARPEQLGLAAVDSSSYRSTGSACSSSWYNGSSHWQSPGGTPNPKHPEFGCRTATGVQGDLVPYQPLCQTQKRSVR